MIKNLDDLDLETLRGLTGDGGPLCARWCARCDEHYRFCNCTEPYWMLRWNGKLVPLPGQKGSPKSLTEHMGMKDNWPDWNGPTNGELP